MTTASDVKKINDRVVNWIMSIAAGGLLTVGVWIASAVSGVQRSVDLFDVSLKGIDRRVQSMEAKLDNRDVLLNQLSNDVNLLKEWKRMEELKQERRERAGR